MSAAWWALGVSVISLGVASASLIWNIRAFRKSGPIVTVELFAGAENSVHDFFIEDTPYLRLHPIGNGDYRVTGARFKLRISNKGRTAISVVDAMLLATDDSGACSWDTPLDLPLRLEAGAAAEFRRDADTSFESAGHFYTQVLLSDGSVILSNEVSADEVRAMVDDIASTDIDSSISVWNG